MKKRELYRLEKSDTGVIVYRTDKNYGRQGVVFADAVRYEYTPYLIPKYIVKECRDMLNVTITNFDDCTVEETSGFTKDEIENNLTDELVKEANKIARS